MSTAVRQFFCLFVFVASLQFKKAAGPPDAYIYQKIDHIHTKLSSITTSTIKTTYHQQISIYNTHKHVTMHEKFTYGYRYMSHVTRHDKFTWNTSTTSSLHIVQTITKQHVQYKPVNNRSLRAPAQYKLHRREHHHYKMKKKNRLAWQLF